MYPLVHAAPPACPAVVVRGLPLLSALTALGVRGRRAALDLQDDARAGRVPELAEQRVRLVGASEVRGAAGGARANEDLRRRMSSEGAGLAGAASGDSGEHELAELAASTSVLS